MYKITKKYEDFLGQDQEESFRFNISEPEMLELVDKDPTFNPDYLLFLTKEPNGIKLINVLRELIVLSYGELSEDGKHFWKDDARATAFVQSAAFEAILSDFIDGEHLDLVKDFILNIFPKKYRDSLAKHALEQEKAQKAIAEVTPIKE